MTRLLPLLLVVALLVAVGCGNEGQPAAEPPVLEAPAARPPAFGLGRDPGSDVEAWDRDIRPDGAGLPPGRGTVGAGADVYARKCARCHGATGIGTETGDAPESDSRQAVRRAGPFVRAGLVGRGDPVGFKLGRRLPRASSVTVGNYWPYATTLYDYLRRAMPADAPGSLTPDELYALCAWLLWRNDLLPAGATLDAESLVRIEMPARPRYTPDRGPDGAAAPL